MKLKDIFLLTLLAFGNASCSDFLDKPINGKLTSDDFYMNEEQCNSAILGCYRSIMPVDWYKVIISRILFDECTDDMWYGNTTQDASKHYHVSHYLYDGKANYDYLNSFYQQNFMTIYNCNMVISKIQESPITNNAFKDQIIAEAKFIRAYSYFELVKSYGGMPLSDKPLSPAELKLKRSSVKETYDFIIKDLLEAKDVLPKTTKEYGRATWGAAMSFLGKAYLYTEDWENAKKCFDEVINSNIYDLEDDFFNVWNIDNPNGVESVFQVQFSNDLTFGQYGNYFCIITASRDYNGWSWGLPTSDLEQAYIDAGDEIRRKYTIIHHGQDIDWDPNEKARNYKVTPSKHKSARVAAKFYIPFDKKTAPDGKPTAQLNYYLMRFADVLLMHAEACMELGDKDSALKSLKRVRDRVNLTTDMTLEGEALRNAIYTERRLELACEGIRLFDLRRWKNPNDKTKSMLSYIMGPEGTFVKRNMNEATADPYEWSNKKEPQNKGYFYKEGVHNLFPIPQTEIDLSGGLIEQNPGL